MRFFRIVVLVFAACWCSEAPVVGVCAGLGLVCPAEAAAVVGTASKIKQTVTGGFDYGLARPMSDNDEVILNETVRTDASGEARLTLGEGTNLIVFAHSSIKVARFTPSNVVMTTADGTFAVSTGSPAPGSYRIDTAAGTLTPHGTRFTFNVCGERLRLDVQEGAVTHCPRGKGKAYCVDVVPGHSVVGQAGAAPQVRGYAEPPAPPPLTPPGAHPTLAPARSYLRAADIPPPSIGAYGVVALRAKPTSANRQRLLDDLRRV